MENDVTMDNQQNLSLFTPVKGYEDYYLINEDEMFILLEVRDY